MWLVVDEDQQNLVELKVELLDNSQNADVH